MNVETAKAAVETLEEINRSLFGLISYLEDRCSEQEFAQLKRELARASNGIDMNIYPIILDQYPELNPLPEQE